MRNHAHSPDGVALAAIQGINEKLESGKQKGELLVQQLQQRLDQKETELTDLKKSVAQLQDVINKLAGERTLGTK